MDGMMHVERCTQLLCMLYKSAPPFLRFPIIHSFYRRKESKAWQVSAVKACNKRCICVTLPSIKRRKIKAEIDACWSALA